MEQLKLEKKNIAQGVINLPGSKSLSNRILLLASIAKGQTKILNLLKSDDTSRMLEALKVLGISYELSEDGSQCVITGNNGVFSSDKALSIFLGNAGTAMRPLTAVLACSNGVFELTGEPRMEERPIKHLIDALRQIDADVTYLKNDGYPPLKINGKNLKGGVVEIDGTVSSQFLTAFLMASPLFDGDTTINIKGDLVSKPYIYITISLMKMFGVDVENVANEYKQFIVKGNQQYVAPQSGCILVEGDASGASYFLAAGAIAGKVKVTGVGKDCLQGDVKFTEVLEQMGANVEIGDDYIECSKSQLKGVDVDLNHIPDAAMTVVPLAIFAEGKTVIRNIANWRVKETDRLSAMATELKKLGVECVEGEDYLEIIPPKKINKNVAIDTYNDHRMAMCFSLVSFMEDIIINDPKCCSKTFPDYFDKFFEVVK